MMSQAEYEKREHTKYLADLARAGKATAHEISMRVARFQADCASEPALVADRVGWLLAGHYGYGAYREAWRMIDRPAPVAEFLEVLACLEWDVPMGRMILDTRTGVEMGARVGRVIDAAKNDPERPVFG